jgi:hypothetical protein
MAQRGAESTLIAAVWPHDAKVDDLKAGLGCSHHDSAGACGVQLLQLQAVDQD